MGRILDRKTPSRLCVHGRGSLARSLAGRARGIRVRGRHVLLSQLGVRIRFPDAYSEQSDNDHRGAADR